MLLHNLLVQFLGEYAGYAWIVHGIVILLAAALIFFVSRKITNHLKVRLANTHNVWDDSFVIAFSTPFYLFIWLVALTMIVHFLLIDNSLDVFSTYVTTLREVSYTALVFWIFVRYVGNVEKKMLVPYAWRKASDPTTVAIVGRLLRLIISVFVVLFLMQLLGFSPTGLLAFGGGGAIVIGFAAQDIMANFFGGLMIFMDKPFKVGDWISSPEKNIEGTVQHIGWRTTALMSFDKRPIYVPNSVFTKIAIVNPQRMTNRRIQTTIGLRYDDASKLSTVVESIRDMLLAHDGIDQKQTLMVHFVSFGPSSLDLDIYCFTKTTVWSIWRDIQQDVYLKILDIVANQRAEVAFPTTTMHLPEGLKMEDPL